MVSLEDRLEIFRRNKCYCYPTELKNWNKKQQKLQLKLKKLNNNCCQAMSELHCLVQSVEVEAEAAQLLEEKNRVLTEILEQETLEKGQIEEARARLLAELEELRSRSKLLASENEGLDEMRRRLIMENDKKAGLLADLEARKNALLNEIEQLRKLVNAEMEKKKKRIENSFAIEK